MKIFYPILSLTALVLTTSVAFAQEAPSVNIMDNKALSIVGAVAKHSPITHWETFFTTLTANVDHPPQPTDETTIDGPLFTWSGGTTQIKRSSDNGKTIDLKRIFPPNTPLVAGNNNIVISCSAKFSRNTKRGN